MSNTAGEFSCKVNPFDNDSIRDGIKKLIDSEEYREQIIKFGQINALKYSAKKIAAAYCNLYHRV